VSGLTPPLARLPRRRDLDDYRRETVKILRGMADAIERSVESPGSVTLSEVMRLRFRAAQLRDELRRWPRA
jgi:hypothetical protein